MNDLKAIMKQKIQDDAYGFPYHYIAEYKNGFTQTLNDTWGICYASTIEYILSELNKDKFSSIVDIGTGDGRLVRELDLFFEGKKITGVDYSEKAINLAKALNPSLDFKCEDIINSKITEKYDIITLIEVFEHVPLDCIRAFINAMICMLNNNGRIYLTVPHVNRTMDDRHFQHFTVERLTEYFGEFFDFEKVIYFEQEKPLLLRIMNRILTNKLFVLNHKGLLNFIYGIYKKKYFFASERNCRRIFIKMKKKATC